MTYYEQEINKVRAECYPNQHQLNAVIATRNYIKDHFAEDLNLDVLAECQCLSKYHLWRLFKRYYGQTPKQFLLDRRIEMAKHYLRKGLTMTQTCYAVGFQSPGSFSNLFKQRVGSSPLKFQKTQLSISKSKR